jgi:hypothetical protein
MDPDMILMALAPLYVMLVVTAGAAVLACIYGLMLLIKAGFELFNNESQQIATQVQPTPLQVNGGVPAPGNTPAAQAAQTAQAKSTLGSP